MIQPPGALSLLLDFDGTLIRIRTPDAVTVSPELNALIRDAAARLAGRVLQSHREQAYCAVLSAVIGSAAVAATGKAPASRSSW